MYYLQSRYYDPQVGRFVNADEVIMAIAVDLYIFKNMFNYCNNNVIMLVDVLGYAPKGSEIPPDSSGYVPPKGGPKKGKTKNGKTGWVDKKRQCLGSGFVRSRWGSLGCDRRKWIY